MSLGVWVWACATGENARQSTNKATRLKQTCGCTLERPLQFNFTNYLRTRFLGMVSLRTSHRARLLDEGGNDSCLLYAFAYPARHSHAGDTRHLPFRVAAKLGGNTRVQPLKCWVFLLGGDTGHELIFRNMPSHSDALGVKVILPAGTNCKQEAKSTHNQSLYHPLRQEAVDIQLARGRNVYLATRHGWRSKFDGGPGGVARSRLRAVIQFRGSCSVQRVQHGRGPGRISVRLNGPHNPIRSGIGGNHRRCSRRTKRC